MSPVSLLLSFGVGVLIPLVAAFVTREALPDKPKAFILTGLSVVSGLIAGIVPNPPVGWHAWEQVLAAIGVTCVSAWSSLVATWVPAKVTASIHKSTDPHFGIGPKSSR